MEAKEQHQLSLKVMRLSRPKLVPVKPLPAELENEPVVAAMAARESLYDPEAPRFPLSSFLMLPSALGTTFLGETFNSYISVHNDSNDVVSDVSVKTILQTGSKRTTLTRPDAGVAAKLSPGHSVDDIVSHEMKELGVHVLICTVNYTTDEGDKKHFRKYFKFQVAKPLDVKSRVQQLSGQLFMEAHISNLTKTPIYLKTVQFQPVDEFDCEDFNQTKDGGSTTSDAPCLAADETRFYLYRLTPKAEVTPVQLRNIKTVGKLDMAWTTGFGELGRLQTTLQRQLETGSNTIPTELVSYPPNIQCGVPFAVTLRVSNMTDKKKALKLSFSRPEGAGILYSGACGVSVLDLEPSQSGDVQLELFPTACGLQYIRGIWLLDAESNTRYNVTDLEPVLVVSPGDNGHADAS